MSKNRTAKNVPPASAKPAGGLGSVVKQANLPLDMLTAVVRWLEAELRNDQYAGLEHAQDASDKRIPLAQVFVDLEVSDSPIAESSTSNEKKKCLIELALQHKPTSFFPGEAISDGTHGYVLIGGPGQGKSTLGQFLAQIHRASWLGHHRSNMTKDGQDTLDVFHAQCGLEKRPATPALPFRIELHDFADWLSTYENSDSLPSLIHYVCERIARMLERFKWDSTITGKQLLTLLEHVPLLLILDGLDEVPPTAGRDLILTAIRQFLGVLAQRKTQGYVVATTRPQGYANEFSDLRLKVLHLQHFSKERALDYVKKFAQVRFAEMPDRQSKIEKLITHASGEPSAARLLRTPLQVTLMTILVEQLGRVPTQQWSLFRDYYRVFYEREMARPTKSAEVLRKHRKYIDLVHARIGLLLQVESEQVGGAGARISVARFEEVVRAVLTEKGIQSAQRELLVDAIREAAELRLVFLVRAEKDMFGFEIRPLQEFMAAWELTQKSDEIVEKRLLEIAGISSFRNVFLFAASRSFSDSDRDWTDLHDAITERICPRLNDVTVDRLAGTTLVGSQLALDLLEEGAVLSQPKHALSLMETAVRLLERPADVFHVRLASLSDEPDLVPTLRTALEKRFAMPEPVNRLSAWLTVSALAERGVAWAKALGDEKWPSAREERRQILEAVWSMPSRHKGIWLLSKMAHEPEAIPFEIHIQQPQQLNADSSWLKAARQAWVPTDWMRVVRLNPHLFAIFRSIVQSEEQKSLLSTAAMAPRSPDWALDVAHWTFAANPCARVLAEQLDYLAAMNALAAARDYHYRFLNGFVAWPLAACVQWCTSSDELRILAGHARAGDLGDTNDWLAAEERWKEREGVALDELNWGIDLPFDRNISERGFPGLSALSWFDDSDKKRDVEPALNDLFRSQTPSRGLLFFVLDAFGGSPRLGSALLSPSRFPDQARRVLASIIRVAQGMISANEIPGMVSDVMQGQRRRNLGLLILSAQSRLQDSNLGLALLYEVDARMPRTASSLHTKLQQGFDALYRRRKSRLHEHGVWDELELPLPRPAAKSREAIPTAPILRSPQFEQIRIENLRVFDSLDIPVQPRSDGHGQWIVLLGENGMGKSTILRAIVFALVDAAITTTLITTSRAQWRRYPASRDDDTATIHVKTREGLYRAEIVGQGDQEIPRPSSANTPLRPWLCAYGCARGSAIGGPARDVPVEKPLDAVATLFDESAKLVHAETWIKERQRKALDDKGGPNETVYQTILEVLKELLRVDTIEISKKDDRVWMTGKDIGHAPLAALSDGYLTTAGWIIDMMARWIDRMEREGNPIPKNFLEEMTGLVLVDEIDLHLHPEWQCKIIREVRRWFPKLTFIVTTHNPLALVGIRPDRDEIIRLKMNDTTRLVEYVDMKKGRKHEPDPRLMTGSEIYRTYFGIESFYPQELGRLLREHRYLAADPTRSVEDDKRLDEIEKKLRDEGIEPDFPREPREPS